jgi:methyltransferase-like protein/2-polyprenyl-3-methyl-5-hydroxy-6-metoxy-1,4-benzoquinol methylase
VIDRAPNPYDEVLYAGYPFPQTHPDRLATLASLFGLSPAPVSHCRVLELGCGDGANLMPMAFGLPQSHFIGIDSAARPIALGQAKVAGLKLENVDLRCCDIMAIDGALGGFDYIIAHGVYSWVAGAVRDRLLAVCREHLAPEGVAYVSYNTYPGYHLRDLVREMMAFHVRDITEPQQRTQQALALLKFLLLKFPTESEAQTDLYGVLLKEELDRMSNYRGREQVYHDELEPANTPVYFYQFIGHAAQHGLQYLAEADFSEMQDHIYPSQVRDILGQFSAEHLILKEQYLDFLKCRTFRQTLLCRQDLTIDRSLNPQRLATFYLESVAQPVSQSPELRAKVVEEFRGPKGATLQTDHPLAKAALLRLSEVSPRSLHFSELLAAARSSVGLQARDTGPVMDDETQAAAEVLFAAYRSGLVQLHVQQPDFALEGGERPSVSRLARWQAAQGPVVTTLLHTSVEVRDPIGLQMLRLLDGTRDRAALRDELLVFVQQNGPFNGPDNAPISDPDEIRRILTGEIERNLRKIARMGLLEA